jgi:3-methyl-2-oxobutanoate hydroxymethyltransferase
VTWTGYRAVGKTPAEAKQLFTRMKEMENAGAYAAELEVVPHQLATYLSANTNMILMSLGSGSGCDTQFLFSCDILGDYDERIPRHSKAYRNFVAERQRLQDERIAAFKEYIEDVRNGSFPSDENTIDLTDAEFAEIMKVIDDPAP